MIRALVFGCIVLGIGLIALMFQASSNNAFFARYYTWLFGLGVALVAGLLGLIGYQISLLWSKLRHRAFGAKLTLRLMAVFALMAVIPGTLVYAISVQFIHRSIDTWFDVPVDKAMEGALNLAKGSLETALEDLTEKARSAAQRLDQHAGDESVLLYQVREQFGFAEAAVYSVDGRQLSHAGADVRLLPDKPAPGEIAAVLQKEPLRLAEAISDRAMMLRVIVARRTGGAGQPAAVLQVLAPAPRSIAVDAQAVEAGVRDYRQLGLQRQGLKQLFALTLTLAVLLTLFSAVSLSFLLSERLSAPLSALAESTRAIAKGDFTKLNPVTSRDEFGVLTQSFNTMTRQLAEASDVVARKQGELVSSKTYLETILANLSSGVVTLDEQLHVRTMNATARDMLGDSDGRLSGMHLSDWARHNPLFVPWVGEVAELLGQVRDKLWQRQISYSTDSGVRTLLIRGARLPAGVESGHVLVLDDISGLIQAQRDAAWGEVARRLAHEIKNPLTPIQLSAERLERKLAGKLDDADREVLARATATIVSQVGSLKQMVDDFSVYSHSVRQKPAQDIDLNALICEVLVLYEATGPQIQTALDASLPRVSGDAASMRQVIHNLMRNAIDALAGVAEPRIEVSTRAGGTMVEFVVADNGSGIREEILPRIFEPYVTSKPKGTGLGLAIVKKIVEDCGGGIRLANGPGGGARAEIRMPAAVTRHAV